MMKRLDIKTGFVCNNNCRFCVQAHNKLKGNRSLEKIKADLIDSKGRCEGVVLTGGEVSIRKDFLEIVRLAKKAGYSTIQVQTNGRMFASADFCKDTIEAGATEFSPAIHGYCSEQHDFLTQSRGSFLQAVRGIKNLKKLGAYVLTNTVVVKPNYRDIPKIARLLVKLGVDQFQFAFVHAIGNAAKNFDSMVPPVSMAAPYIHQGLEIGKRAGRIVMAEAMPYCMMKGYEEFVAERVIPETEIRGLKQQNVDDYTKQRIVRGKAKFDKCRLCIHDNYCEGPWKEYPEKKGEAEFLPVTFPFLKNRRYKEFLGLIKGIKPAIRDTISSQDINNLKSVCSSNSFHVDFSDYSISYSKGLSVRKGLKEGDRRVYYVSKERGGAKRLKYLESRHDLSKEDYAKVTEEIGKMLGYPGCCISFFIKHHKKTTPEIYFDVARNTRGKFFKELNIVEEEKRLISHIPCSFDCEESREYAKKVAQASETEAEDSYYLFFRDGCFISMIPRLSSEFLIKKVSSGYYGGRKDSHQLLKLACNGMAIRISRGRIALLDGHETVYEQMFDEEKHLMLAFE